MALIPHGNQAIVIGASMAGLLTARILADHFVRVIIVERDPLPPTDEPRRGVPQGRHAHGLLAKGQSILAELFPGLIDDLLADGAVAADMSQDALWYQYGGYKCRFASGHRGTLMSRPLLEGHIRRRVMALPNVALVEECDVLGLVTTEDRRQVTGITLQWRQPGNEPVELEAELVVDAGGRGARAGAWLEQLGYERAPEEVVKINVGYVTRLYRRRPDDLPGGVFAIAAPTPPHERRMGVMFPLEGDRWIVSLGGWLGDHAPTDEAGFLEYARSLPTPDIYNVIRQAEPLGDFVVHKFPTNLRRHYQRLKRVPEGYLVIGDALCSFNPIYGQGMTTSAMAAMTLDRCLRELSSLSGLPQHFYRRVASVIDIPWQLAATADFAYPGVEGLKAPGTDFLNWYIGHVQRALNHDPVVYSAFLDVMNLLKPPTSLLAPHLAWRVLRTNLNRRAALGQPAVATAGGD